MKKYVKKIRKRKVGWRQTEDKCERKERKSERNST